MWNALTCQLKLDLPSHALIARSASRTKTPLVITKWWCCAQIHKEGTTDNVPHGRKLKQKNSHNWGLGRICLGDGSVHM
jgi:hypothetical protein